MNRRPDLDWLRVIAFGSAAARLYRAPLLTFVSPLSQNVNDFIGDWHGIATATLLLLYGGFVYGGTWLICAWLVQPWAWVRPLFGLKPLAARSAGLPASTTGL